MHLSYFIFGIALCFSSVVLAQGNCYNVLVKEADKSFKVKAEMAKFHRTGFYLYRNCLYNLELKDGKQFSGRLIEIQPDTLLFTNFLNKNVAAKHQQSLDTFAIHTNELKYLILDGVNGLKKRYLDICEFSFFKDSVCNRIESAWLKEDDSSLREIVPYLNEKGIRWIWEVDSIPRKTVYFRNGEVPYRREMQGSYKRKFIRFLSSNDRQIDEVDGISISLLTTPSSLKDSLIINGINLELNPLALFTLVYGFRFLPSREVANYKPPKQTEVYINGIGVSVGGYLTTHTKINGMYIGGLISDFYKMNGLSISGLNSTIYDWKGVTLATIGNQSKKGRGLQISLFNFCANFRGVQLGLWNKNAKRALPLINWQFKD